MHLHGICVVQNGTAALAVQVLEFQIRKEMTLEMWTDRQDKIQTFFGPGVIADIQKTQQVRAFTCQIAPVKGQCVELHRHAVE